MHVFIAQLRPHNTRHLNALYLPQFLSHLSLKTSHTPTFKPTACCLSLMQAAPAVISSDGTTVVVEVMMEGSSLLKSIKVGAQLRWFSICE